MAVKTCRSKIGPPIGLRVILDSTLYSEMSGASNVFNKGVLMLVKTFKFKRNTDKGGFQWTAESTIEAPGFYRAFTAVGKTLADVKEFAALVRWCERTGSLERLSEMHPPGYERRLQTTWGGNW